MPHKHTRSAKAQQASNFELPPSAVAKPLPVGKPSFTATKSKKSGLLRNSDDTPKAFARLLQYQESGKRPSGLDDGGGLASRKKRKRNNDADTTEPAHAQQAVQVPKILPGERMSDFSARVNQALPIGGLGRKGRKIAGSEKEGQTKLEKKIQRRIAEWRADEAKRKEKEEEADDIAEEEAAANWTKTQEDVGRRRKGRKGGVGGGDDDDRDPWEKLKDARDKPRGLFDVAQAPPDFERIPRERFKVKNGARADVVDVPRASGSLRKREELGDARKNIIEQYRRLMASKNDTAV